MTEGKRDEDEVQPQHVWPLEKTKQKKTKTKNAPPQTPPLQPLHPPHPPPLPRPPSESHFARLCGRGFKVESSFFLCAGSLCFGQPRRRKKKGAGSRSEAPLRLCRFACDGERASVTPLRAPWRQSASLTGGGCRQTGHRAQPQVVTWTRAVAWPYLKHNLPVLFSPLKDETHMDNDAYRDR